MQILLEYGLEDAIPIPEAAESPPVLSAIGDRDVFLTLSRALEELVRSGQLRLYRARWDLPEQPVTDEDLGLALLKDSEWYSFHLDDDESERLYFVNVKNIRSP